MGIRSIEARAMDAFLRLERSADEALHAIDQTARTSPLTITDGDSLSGEMTALPVKQGTGGALYINIDNVGLGVVLFHNDGLLVTQFDCPADMTFGGSHWHQSVEMVHVISGSCEFPHFGEVLEAGKSYVVPAREPHVWRSGPKGCKMLVIWAPALSLVIEDE